ncbi:MAG: DUF192 domain-containing protein [Pseudomonadota bacterium]
MRSFLVSFVVAVLAIVPAHLVAVAQVPGVDAPQPTLETSPLIILQGDTSHTFEVELANDPDEIRVGMMFRESMDARAGMLFDMGNPRPVSFWMKNTILPLDMLFMDESGTVLAIAENAVPFSRRQIDPGMAVKAVLEVNAGIVDELGLAPGAQIEHPVFTLAGE